MIDSVNAKPIGMAVALFLVAVLLIDASVFGWSLCAIATLAVIIRVWDGIIGGHRFRG